MANEGLCEHCENFNEGFREGFNEGVRCALQRMQMHLVDELVGITLSDEDDRCEQEMREQQEAEQAEIAASAADADLLSRKPN